MVNTNRAQGNIAVVVHDKRMVHSYTHINGKSVISFQPKFKHVKLNVESGLLMAINVDIAVRGRMVELYLRKLHSVL